MAAIYSNGGNRWNILDFNFTKRDALSSLYKLSIIIIYMKKNRFFGSTMLSKWSIKEINTMPKKKIGLGASLSRMKTKVYSLKLHENEAPEPRWDL